ncbi:restriction endonuclease subunit S [Thalassospiraceae bacterium LMO-JJ14]|nr:restriction endonuclease subunit S [Thalassospiraceae bacterium LMO-JJ14]
MDVNLPNGWSITSLDKFTQTRGSSINPAKSPDEVFELYSVPSYDIGMPESTLGSEIGSSKQAVTPLSVLLCKINPRINRSWVVGEAAGYRQIASTEWIVFPPSDAYEPEYLCYFLRQHSVRDYLAQNVSGVGGSLMRVKASTLKDFPFPVAPRVEQRRIVEKIETLFARLDKGEEALREVQKLLARYRQSVLKAAVTGQLTADWRAENADRLEHGRDLLARILETRREQWSGRGKYKDPAEPNNNYIVTPDGWATASLQMVSHKVTDGTHQSPEFADSGIPFIVIANVKKGRIDWSSVNKWVSIETYAELTRNCMPEKGDILYTAVGSYGIALHVVDDRPFVFQRHIAHIKPLNGVMNPDFLVLVLNSPQSLKHAHQVARGVAQKTVTLGELSQFLVPIPSTEEQARIVDIVAEKTSQNDALETWCQAELKRSNALRQSILKDAFAGCLVPQDPNDEPAAELLARIKEEGARGAART